MIELPGILRDLQPDTAAAFLAAADIVLPYSDASLRCLSRRHLQATQERTVCHAPDNATDLERAVASFADQFATSVAHLEPTLVEQLTALSDEASVSALVNAMYLLDMEHRLKLVVPKVLPGDSTDNPSAGTSVAAPGDETDSERLIADAIARFAAAAVLADRVDPLTSELVRLRCAQIHDCRLCGSLRQKSALDSGLDPAVDRRIADYERGGFPESQVAALTLCDTLILNPSDASSELGEHLARFYSPEQVAEICFDVVKWSQQKVLVALSSDAPPWEGIHVLDFDGDGHPVFAGPVTG